MTASNMDQKRNPDDESRGINMQAPQISEYRQSKTQQ
jgi:hypothetical protein